MELQGKLRGASRPGALPGAAVRYRFRGGPDVDGENKTGTLPPGLLYVDNRGIVGRAGLASV
jgi:hypothetical protein